MLLTFLVTLPLLTAFFIAMLQPKHLRLIEKAVVVSALIELSFALLLIPEVISRGAVKATTFFSLDPLGAFLSLIIALVGFFVALYSVGYLRAEVEKQIIGPRRVRQFFLLFELFLFAMFLAVATINPVIMWIAIEATTLSTAFLISFYNKPSATEAAWKYLIINSLGLLLGLLGTLIFLAVPEMSTSNIDWQTLQSAVSNMSPLIIQIAFIFILVGYGTKAGLVPLHTWKPDTYAKAPTPVVALLSGVLLNVSFFAILKFKKVVDGTLGGDDFTSGLLIFFGVTSLLLAALIIFIQKNYKRLLAYSSIEHAGLLALGFGFGGVAAFAALLHMLFHALTKALLFFAAGNMFLKYSSTKMKNVSGLLKTLPVTAPTFFAGFIAIVGLPPFGLFTTKFLLLSSGVENHPYIVTFAVLVMAIVFFGFFKHMHTMLFGEAPEGIARGESNLLTQIPMLLLLGLILALSWNFPDILESLIRIATDQLTLNS